MTIRARMRPVEVWFWRYNPKENVPFWVIRHFHRLGSGECLETVGGHVVLPGQYCGLVEPHGTRQPIMFTTEEYNVMWAAQQLELAPDEPREDFEL